MDSLRERIISIFELYGCYIEVGEEDINILEYGIDSITFMSIIMEIEEEFQIMIFDEKISFDLFASLNGLESFIKILIEEE